MAFPRSGRPCFASRGVDLSPSSLPPFVQTLFTLPLPLPTLKAFPLPKPGELILPLPNPRFEVPPLPNPEGEFRSSCFVSVPALSPSLEGVLEGGGGGGAPNFANAAPGVDDLEASDEINTGPFLMLGLPTGGGGTPLAVS